MQKKNMVAISDIVVSRERMREDVGDVEDLAQSLMTFGQLQPVIIDSSKELIAGFRRFTAAQLNGWTQIWAVTPDDLDVDMLLAREIELEENIRRKQMTWHEEQRAIVEIGRLRKERDPAWGQAQTAQVANISQNRVSEAETLVKMMDLFPELKEAKNKSQAMSWAKAKSSNIVRIMDVQSKPAQYKSIEERLWLGDSTELIRGVPDESINAIITDPPFGINFDERKTGSIGSLTDYEDGEESYLRLLAMGPEMYRVLKPNGWLVWFLGISWYERAKVAFREAGFTVDEIPIIWDRSGGRNYTTRPDRYFARSYDIALHCIKGDPQIIQRNKSNIIRVAPVTNDERLALVERPVELYAELIRRLTVAGETVADFFTGSGSCLAAAASLGRDYFGCELSPERRAIAIKKIEAHTPKP